MVAHHDGQRDAAYLAESIVSHGVTMTFFVPSMLSLFIEEPRLAQASSLRKVICGGESLSAETVQQFYRPAAVGGVTPCLWTDRDVNCRG